MVKTLTPPRPARAKTRANGKSNGKLFYRINEVAKITGLKPYVLRYWETEFPELAPAKDSSDQRRYRPADIEVIQTIRRLLYKERYTIEGARKRLKIELRNERRGNGTASKQRAVSSVPSTTLRAKQEDKRLQTSLRNLRIEVNALLSMLS